MGKRFSPASPALADLLIVLLTLFAPAFAATNQLAGKAVLVLGAGLLWLIAPPPAVDLRKAALVGIIFLCALFPLLPATWFPTPPWRETLTAVGAPLPATYTPHPWLTLEHALLLASGLAWLLLLISRPWHVERGTLLGIYAAGMTVLVLLWLMRSGLGGGVTAGQFGSFANRNQSAHVLAVAGVVMLALALNGWREHRPAALAWLAPLMMVMVALLRAGSRAGILLFVMGCGGWLLISGRLGLRLRWIPLAASAAMIFAAIVFLFGERILARLPTGEGAGEITADMRVRIWRDTMPFLRDASWHGHGLGNFSPLFARYRQASANPDRVIHPESDWLWAAAELGAPALVPLVVLLFLVVRGCWPMDHGTSRLLRSAALVAASLTIVHAFVDVSAHRVGSLWPSLFLLGIATWPNPARVGSGSWRMRCIGMPLIALGIIWIASSFKLLNWPSSAQHQRLVETVRNGSKERDYTAVLSAANAGLQIAPANWEFWFARGAARAATVAATGNARADFAVARWLEPSAKVPFEEGRAWLIREGPTNETVVFFGPEPRFAAEAWQAALAMNPKTFPGLFPAMVQTARQHPEVAAHVAELAGNDPEHLAEVLLGLPMIPFTNTVSQLLTVDPALKQLEPAQRSRLFREWFQRGNRERLEEMLNAHPEWLAESWPVLGDLLAARGDFPAACRLAGQHLPEMEIPVIDTKPIARARADHLSRPRDVVAGLAFFKALLRDGDRKEAARVLTSFSNSADAPSYVHGIAARFWQQEENWEVAWQSYRRAAGR